jgi:hypothetical protein
MFMDYRMYFLPATGCFFDRVQAGMIDVAPQVSVSYNVTVAS